MSISISNLDTVELSKLPLSIQKQIPYSIRTKKDLYNINELPKNIQYLIIDYKKDLRTIDYDVLFDTIPTISRLGDFTTITNYFDLVVEYLKNYLMLTKGQYPFDPLFYSQLKYYIQTKDTSLQNTLISNEINRIVGILSTDLSIDITVKKLKIDKSNVSNDGITFFVNVTIQVNDETKQLSLEVL